MCCIHNIIIEFWGGTQAGGGKSQCAPPPLYATLLPPIFFPFYSLALVDDNTLLIGSVDQIQMLHIQTIPLGETPKYTLCVVDLHVFSIVIDFFYYYACVYAQLLNCRSVPGKCSWALKHKSRFWFAWALTHNITCIEAYPKVGACPGPYSIIVMYIHCTCTREQ